MPNMGSAFGWFLFLALLCGFVAFVVGGILVLTGPIPGDPEGFHEAVLILVLFGVAAAVFFALALRCYGAHGTK
jgi:hypothetical protein